MLKGDEDKDGHKGRVRVREEEEEEEAGRWRWDRGSRDGGKQDGEREGCVTEGGGGEWGRCVKRWTALLFCQSPSNSQ